MSFLKLLASYYWPVGLMKDASKGNLFERSAAFTHNREQAEHFPIYIRRWAFLLVVSALISNVGGVIGMVSGIITMLAAVAMAHLMGIWLRLKNNKDKG
jgi:hypothetical protein